MNCPKCNSDTYYELRSRPLYRCKDCGHDFSATSGTPFRARKLPLSTYCEIRELMNGGVNARQISLRLGIQYKTTYRITRLMMKFPDDAAAINAPSTV